ncbi:MAG: hypothetical protein QOD29_6267 [Alphaproteobacteria bacterium]|jgi:hypothetical protein|nr:hypothetical protein [Alphaproteobacteria bacterium]
MHLERTPNGSPMPEASRKLAGGANHRTGMENTVSPGRGDGMASRDFRRPCRGLRSYLQETGGLHHGLISDVPPGQGPPSAVKVHDTL